MQYPKKVAAAILVTVITLLVAIENAALKRLLSLPASLFSSGNINRLGVAMQGVADVEIDRSGVFKYILIQVLEKESKETKSIVRGFAHCEYHNDIFEDTSHNLGEKFKLKCLGGGRIRHEPEKKAILVYGYSQGYGRANHEVTVDILKKKYPEYKIDYSNDGY